MGSRASHSPSLSFGVAGVVAVFHDKSGRPSLLRPPSLLLVGKRSNFPSDISQSYRPLYSRHPRSTVPRPHRPRSAHQIERLVRPFLRPSATRVLFMHSEMEPPSLARPFHARNLRLTSE